MNQQCKYALDEKRNCGSYALNDHPESGLCDKHYWRVRAEAGEALHGVCLALCDKMMDDNSPHMKSLAQAVSAFEDVWWPMEEPK